MIQHNQLKFNNNKSYNSKILTGTRSGYFLRIFSPSALLFSKGCSSLYKNFMVDTIRQITKYKVSSVVRHNVIKYSWIMTEFQLEFQWITKSSLLVCLWWNTRNHFTYIANVQEKSPWLNSCRNQFRDIQNHLMINFINYFFFNSK